VVSLLPQLSTAQIFEVGWFVPLSRLRVRSSVHFKIIIIYTIASTVVGHPETFQKRHFHTKESMNRHQPDRLDPIIHLRSAHSAKYDRPRESAGKEFKSSHLVPHSTPSQVMDV